MDARLAALLVVVMGCRPAPEPVAHPEAQPEPWVDQAIPTLVTPPAIDPVVPPPADDAGEQALRAIVRRPLVLKPGRPLAGGEPLRVADLTMIRGELEDAAVQYHALLGDPRPEVAAYVRWRLGVTYVRLDRPAEAEPLLEEAAGSATPSSWPAAVALAGLRAERDGAVAALRTTRSYAGDRIDDLESELIVESSGADRAALLLARARRASAAGLGCGDAFTALDFDRSAADDKVVMGCFQLLASGELEQLAPQVYDLVRRNPPPDILQLRLAETDDRWRTLDGEVGLRTQPRLWIDLANVYLGLYLFDRKSAAGLRASWWAVAALDNAARLAIVKGADLDSLRTATRICRAVDPQHGERAMAICRRLADHPSP